MPVMLPNVLLNTSRNATSTTSAGTATLPPQPFLARIPAHMEPMYAHHLTDLPTSATGATHFMSVDATTDVQMTDIITSITKRDGVTPWPGDIPTNSYTWTIKYVRVSGDGPLTSRYIYVARLITGGAIHY